MFLSNEDREAFEAALNITNRETIQNIAAMAEERVIEKMLQVDDSPVEFKAIEFKDTPNLTCPKGGPGHFIIKYDPKQIHMGSWSYTQNWFMCNCGIIYYEECKVENGRVDYMGKSQISGKMNFENDVPEYIKWAASCSWKSVDPNMDTWIQFMKNLHCKNVVIRKEFEKTLKGYQELPIKLNMANQKCVQLNHTLIENNREAETLEKELKALKEKVASKCKFELI